MLDRTEEHAELMRDTQVTDTDAKLESMTSALLQVTSVFLIQQNELQEVRERLQKELMRVTQIQDALTQAAQQHQDAVMANWL